MYQCSPTMNNIRIRIIIVIRIISRIISNASTISQCSEINDVRRVIRGHGRRGMSENKTPALCTS